jgi:uncharacterized BrkB/YihY/UPF0761 family membrane protein
MGKGMAASAYRLQETIYGKIIYFTYFLMIVSALGMSEYAPKYLSQLHSIVNIYICIFLIWRFNPFRKKIKFHDLDRRVAFSAGVFILTTTILNIYIVQFKDALLNLVSKR